MSRTLSDAVAKQGNDLVTKSGQLPVIHNPATHRGSAPARRADAMISLSGAAFIVFGIRNKLALRFLGRSYDTIPWSFDIIWVTYFK